MHKLDSLLNVMGLVQSYLGSNLNVGRKSQIVSCELLYIRLHRCTKHVKSFIVTDARKHLMFFF